MNPRPRKNNTEEISNLIFTPEIVFVKTGIKVKPEIVKIRKTEMFFRVADREFIRVFPHSLYYKAVAGIADIYCIAYTVAFTHEILIAFAYSFAKDIISTVWNIDIIMVHSDSFLCSAAKNRRWPRRITMDICHYFIIFEKIGSKFKI